MFCQKCGIENKDDATFCKSCGAQFKEKEEWSSVDAWNEVNGLTRWSIGIILILAFLCYILKADGFHIFSLIIGVLIGYFWTGPFSVDIAREHNRNISWAYFIGFVLCFVGWFFYWVYVKLTNDP
jgi:hypothetical protein